MPALVLNYFGQGALILADPTAVKNPFYLLAPAWALLPLVVLATCATVIASQAVISGAFSLTRQAIQLGYCPRLTIMHTSERQIGQIYIPFVNWALLIAVILLVIGFRSSSNLAGAYGIAVTLAMLIDSISLFVVMRRLWLWPTAFALAVAIAVRRDRRRVPRVQLAQDSRGRLVPDPERHRRVHAVDDVEAGARHADEAPVRRRDAAGPLHPERGSVAAHTGAGHRGIPDRRRSTGVPHALLHNLKHNKVLHGRIVFLTVITGDVPSVPVENRYEAKPLGCDFFQIVAHYGFKDDPDIPELLEECGRRGFVFDMMETSFFVSRETLIATVAPGMALWRERLFVSMSKNATKASDFFRIPSNRVVELGTQVEL